ncbi:MAG: hypothetical protein HWN66_00395, partial [Candidatus Helarchaeota archaeon]|nr:hypothetical protein [Candidatus Helarchaeota archaeon]
RWQDYPLEPVVDYLNKVRDEQGLNMPVAAGINARLLRDGPIDKIVDNVKRFIDTFAREHELTVFLANIPADTPSENVHAAIAAAHTYGLKPIADDLDKIKFKPPKRESFQEFKKNLAKNAK